MVISRHTIVLALASLCASAFGCGARTALTVGSMARGGASTGGAGFGGTQGELAAHGGKTADCARAAPAEAIPSGGSNGTGDGNGGGPTRVLACKVQLMLGGVPGTALGGTAASRATAAYATSGDFNQDGILDLATADTETNLISILLGHGDGNFTVLNYRTGPRPTTLTAADLNGDGHQDLVTITRTLDQVDALEVRLGAGDGTFAFAASYTLGTFLREPTVGDFDGDHVLDIAVAGNGLRLLHGNGDGSLRIPDAASAMLDGRTPTRIEATDLDGDGRLDLVLGFSSLMSVLLSQGNGRFSNPRDYPGGSDSTSLNLGDFNGDGQLDVVTQGECGAPDSGIGTWLFAGIGAGLFAPASLASEGCSNGHTLAASINSDQRLDLVGHSFLFGQADGSFESVPNELASDGNPVWAVGDFNGDGLVDLAVGRHSIKILFGKGDGTFGTARAINGSNAVLVDMNADSRLDVVSASEPPGGVNVLLGVGDGSFAARVSGEPLCSTCQLGSDLLTPDLNGDHLPDLVAVDTTVRVALNDGKGGYWAAVSVTKDWTREGFSDGTSVAAGDVDGDDIPDLVATSSRRMTLSLLRGKGDGQFAPDVDRALMTSPHSIRLGDLNRDGKLDLVLAGDHEVLVMLGDGNGTFVAGQSYEQEYLPVIELGDLNGDGNLDLIVSGSEFVRVQLGIGDGTFGAARDYDIGARPGAFAFGDLNRDGSLDLLVGTDRLLALFGTGDGGFACLQDYIFESEPAPRRISVGDVNHDCKLDVLVSGSNARLLLNTTP